ncbi:MAG: hypothetical protein J0L61_04935, partial [Planctomycetes bacterium]|nr:hypothetical protein [Planctomycetota bacterium]
MTPIRNDPPDATSWYTTHYASSIAVSVDVRDPAFNETGWLCPRCRSVRRVSAAPKRLTVRQLPRACSLNIIYSLLITVARRGVLEALGAEIVARCFHLIELADEDGRLCKDHVTTVCLSRVRTRGDALSTCRTCEGCGRLLIWAHGDVYATRPPDESYPIHQDNGGGWIVREDVARKLLA